MNEFLEKEGLDWSKWKAVTTDGAAVMQGLQKGVVKGMQLLHLNCVRICCILHHQTLVT